MNEKPYIAYEQYEIVFTHTFCDGKGKRFTCEEPIVVRSFQAALENFPVSYLLNEMIEKLREELLRRAGRFCEHGERKKDG